MTEFQGEPAYRQLASALRRRIEAGDIPNGAPLPSAARLMREFGVSSTVVKNGLSLLRTEGLIVGHQGKGVFAQYPPVVEPPSWALPLVEAARNLAALTERVAGGHEVEPPVARDALAAWRRVEETLPEQLRTGNES